MSLPFLVVSRLKQARVSPTPSVSWNASFAPEPTALAPAAAAVDRSQLSPDELEALEMKEEVRPSGHLI